MTYLLLDNAPPQDSSEFIDYLREHNVVVLENEAWIVIENCKYHTPKKAWLTAFYKHAPHSALNSLSWLGYAFMNWRWLKKETNKQTVPDRFHIHLIEPVVE